jgi:two-component system chemotaxis sensor kinase CheA
MNPAVESFRVEAVEILEALDAQLLELEANPTDMALVNAVFRGLHTLKGSGGMFGFTRINGLLHGLEDIFDEVRSGRARVDSDLIGMAFSARDMVETLLEEGPDGADADPLPSGDGTLMKRIRSWRSLAQHPGALGDSPPAAPPRRYAISFAPDADALRNGMRPDRLMRDLAELGPVTIETDFSRIPVLGDLDPKVCHIIWHALLETDRGIDAIKDVFLFATDGSLLIEPIDSDAAEVDPPPTSTPADRRDVERVARGLENREANATVRVQSARLDALMDQIGELVIVQARLDGVAAKLGDKALKGIAEEVERLVTGLRDQTMALRMLPVDRVFGKFARVVRDLSAELGKPVRLETRGAETEIDKSLIDILTEPLVHVIRNAIDHGIEDAETRKRAGKPVEARIGLQARQAGGEILISVADDGGGLDTEAILARAVERGLVAADAAPPADAIHQMIFEPGFSTAKVLSEVSGRGVGMDAVRRTIEDRGGTVVIDTRRGAGTRITMRLPVNTAIIDGLLVRVGDVPFVIPMSAVTECVEMPKGPEVAKGQALLRVRDDIVPYVTLSRSFGFAEPQKRDPRVIITSAGGRRTGLVVDSVIGQRQTVVKGLTPYHEGIPGLAGSTILADGRVALILDPQGLLRAMTDGARAAA